MILLSKNKPSAVKYTYACYYFASLKKCKDNSSSYLELIRAAGSLLFDARHHVFLHLVQDRVEGGELSLQVLLDSVGVRLVSQTKMTEYTI